MEGKTHAGSWPDDRTPSAAEPVCRRSTSSGVGARYMFFAFPFRALTASAKCFASSGENEASSGFPSIFV